MGNCCGTDVETKYQVGGQSDTEKQFARDAEQAVALLSGTAAYSSWVDVHISCQDLKDADVFSKSDPFAIMYMKKEGNWAELARTEVIANTLSPTFAVGLKVLYNFEKRQDMKVVLLDLDKGQDAARVLQNQCDFLGEAEFTLSHLVTAPNRRLELPLTGKTNGKGKVRLVCDELPQSKEVLEFVLAARALLNVETFSRSDPFLEISRMQDEAGTWVPVYRTEVKNNNLNPTWAPIKIRGTMLNMGDIFRPLRLKVFDYESGGNHRLLGQAETTSEKLQAMSGATTEIELKPVPGAVEISSNKPRGFISVKSYKCQVQPSFLDYIQGGVELNFMVAVDFTASNGQTYDEKSKHYLNPAGGYTAYEHAILGVGRVLEFYDNDRRYPVYGFGGRFGTRPVNHCFPLTGSDQNPFCEGVNGILGAYRTALQSWQLSGPTLFAPVIRCASQWAAVDQPPKPLKYTILLILTDGVIMDMDDTIHAIIAASQLPMSILIVGIGDEDFTAMSALDSDKALLHSRSQPELKASRDIVQFVEFNKFKQDGDKLAAELLAELPGQFLKYVRQHNVPIPGGRV